MKKESLSLITVKTLLTVIIFAGIGTIIIGGGYLIGDYYKGDVDNQINKKEIKDEKTIQDETADWKTYRNEEYGFEVKYPLDFKEQKIESDEILLEAMKTDRGSSHRLSMYVIPNYKIAQIVSRVSETEEIIIGDHSGYKYFYIEGAGMSEVALIQLGEDALNVSFDCIGTNPNFAIANDRKIFVQDFFNQILYTFKFIEKGEIADWKTYRNEEYGFEVKYSQDWEKIDKTPAIISFACKDNENNIIQIRNIDRENDISLTEQIKGKGDIEPELIKINNRDLYFLKISMAGLIFYEYYVENKNKIFIISMMDMSTDLSKNAQDESDIKYSTDEELSKELNILRTTVSTFKFIEN